MTPTPGMAASSPGAASSLSRIKDRARHAAHAALRPLVTGLSAVGITANHLTILGALIGIAASLAFFEGAFRLGAWLLVASGLCDVLDGELARASRRVTRFGAFLDSTLDRFAEALVLLGIAGFYIVTLVELTTDPTRVLEQLARGLEPRTWAIVAITALLALVASFLVSYTRARAEGLGLECKVGWFERPERMVVLIVAGLFGVGPVMPGALLLLALLSFVTAAQRVRHVYRVTRRDGGEVS